MENFKPRIAATILLGKAIAAAVLSLLVILLTWALIAIGWSII